MLLTDLENMDTEIGKLKKEILESRVKGTETLIIALKECGLMPEAFIAAKENADSNDLIFVGGSTFVVAEII